jgi:outer membrane lipoprotein-sorting protein
MVRYLTAPVLAAVVVLVALTCSADAAALNVEEQLQLLQAKVNQLEAQVQQHVSIN